MTLWCAAKSPLLLGNNLTAMTAQTLAIVGNTALLEVNQDPLGMAARRIDSTDTQQLWFGPLSRSRHVLVMLNLANSTASLSVPLQTLGFAPSQKLSTRVAPDHSSAPALSCVHGSPSAASSTAPPAAFHFSLSPSQTCNVFLAANQRSTPLCAVLHARSSAAPTCNPPFVASTPAPARYTVVSPCAPSTIFPPSSSIHIEPAFALSDRVAAPC